MIGPYETPFAFGMALEERLRNVSLRQGTDLQRLRRRVAFERLLARLFADEKPPWLLKGGAMRWNCAWHTRQDRHETSIFPCLILSGCICQAKRRFLRTAPTSSTNTCNLPPAAIRAMPFNS